MKFDNKTFQQKYEAWKNGADYWKDIRGVNLGQQAQEEPSEEEQKKLDNQVTNILAEYNRGKGNQISVSPQQAYWNHMMKAGVDPIVAAGIAGNIQQESSFNHRASNGTHWGLVQTDKNITDYIKKAYGDFSRDSQMNFISDMAMGTPRQIKHKMYNEVLSRSKAFRGEKYKTAQDAAKGWEIYFERSGGSGVGKRQRYASNIYNKYYHPMPTAAQLAEQNMQASPIIQNTPSIKQPQTINAAIPRTLLGPTTNQNNIDAKNLMHRKMYEEITTPTLPNILNLLPTNNFGKDSYGQKFWWRRGNNLHFKCGKDNLPKFTDGDDGNTFGGNIAKALGAGEIGQEIANFGTQMIPVVGTYYDWKTAVNDPSIENIGTALITTAGDIFTLGAGGIAIRAGLKAAKAAAKYKKAMTAYNTAKTLVPGTKQVTRAIRVAGNAADEARIAAYRYKAIKNIKNSTKATVATHLTDAKDLYERVKKHYNK